MEELDDLIQIMVNETFGELGQADKSADIIQLAAVGSNPMGSVLESNCLELVYIDALKVFRLIYEDKIVDFPSNWSIFENLAKDLTNPETCSLYYLNRNADFDSLLDCLGRGKWHHLLLMSNNGRCWAYYSGSEEDQSVEKLKAFMTEKCLQENRQHQEQKGLNQAA